MNEVRGFRFILKLLQSRIFLALVVFSIVFGPDVVENLRDRMELRDLRRTACDLFAERRFLQPEEKDRCREDVEIYRQGLLHAIQSRTPRLRDALAETTDHLSRVTETLDHDDFTPQTLGELWERYDPLAFLVDRKDNAQSAHYVVHADWLMVNGYGSIRVEMPDGAERKGTDTGLLLVPAKGLLRNVDLDLLNHLCRRTDEIDARCSGTLYLIEIPDEVLGRAVVVGMTLDPISDRHLELVGLRHFDPPFESGSTGAQLDHIRVFLNVFSQNNGSQPAAEDANPKTVAQPAAPQSQ